MKFRRATHHLDRLKKNRGWRFMLHRAPRSRVRRARGRGTGST